MANNDFFISFGSDAKTFGDRLKRDLEPAKAEILGLQSLLTQLASDVDKNGPMLGALQRTLGQAHGSGSGSGASIEKMQAAAEDFRRELKDLSSELGTVVAGLKAAAGQMGRVSEGRGNFVGPNGVILGDRAQGISNAQAAAVTPGARRMGSLPADPVLIKAIERLATQDRPAATTEQHSRGELEGALTRARAAQADLKSEVAAAESAIAQATAEIGRMHTSAESGSSKAFDPAAYERQQDKLDLATKNLGRFNSELTVVQKTLGSLEQRLASAEPANRPTTTVEAAPRPVVTEAAPRIADIGKVELDQAAFDRVVHAVNEVRDEVRKLVARPVETAPAGGGGTAARGSKAAAAPSAAPVAEAEAEVKAIETKEQELRRTIAELDVQKVRLTALMAEAGDAVDESVHTMLDQTTRMASMLRGELAQLERETTGITKGEQSARNKAQYQTGPDLPEEEYNRRRQMRQRLDLALSPETFRESIGTGTGKLRKDDLIAMAKQLGQLGFSTLSDNQLRKSNVFGTEQKPGLYEHVVSARQAMLENYGAEVPTELQTGRKLVADKVSDAVRKILEDANISAAEAAEEFAAREAIRTARMAGHLPKDPAARSTQVTAEGATSLAGQRLSGAIGVPPGMHKGGEYNDVYGMLPALEMLHGRALGRAANLAMQPGYDPFRINAGQEIKGGGEQAQTARQAFRALRQATNELDDLGGEFETFATAITENEGFISRATSRLEKAHEAGLPTGGAIAGRQKSLDAELESALQNSLRRFQESGHRFGTPQDQENWLNNNRNVMRMSGRYSAISHGDLEAAGLHPGDAEKLAEDAAKIEAAEANIARLMTKMASGHFKGLQDVFEDPVYQSGRHERDISRAQYQAQMEDADRRQRETFIGDAAGYAIGGSRLSPGTKDTYISSVPGLSYRGMKNQFGFRDQGRDPAQLASMNQAWLALTGRSGEGGLIAHQRGIAQEVEAGDRPQADLDKVRRKVEGKATTFLNQMSEIFGMAPSMESLLARPGESYNWVNPENQAADAGRQRKVLDAQYGEAESVARSKGTPEEKATASVAEAKHRLAEATKKQAEKAEELTALEAELLGSLGKEERAAVEAVGVHLKRLQAERNALENARHPRPDVHGEAIAQPDPKAAEGVRQNVERQRAEVAALTRQQRSQRGAMTRLDKVVAGGDEAAFTSAFYAKYDAAEKRLAATTEKLAAEREQLVRLEGQMGAKVAAAEAGARSQANLANEYRDRGHHPGEPLDVNMYPTRLGYGEDAEAAKKRLDREIEQARSQRSQLIGVDDARTGLAAQRDQLRAAQPDIRAKIASAREEGDLKENAGYHAAREELARNEAQVAAIEAKLGGEGLEKLEKLATELESINRVVVSIAEEVAKAEDKLAKAAAKGREANAPNAADRVQSDTAEARQLREQKTAAEALRRQATQLRALKAKAGTPDEKAAFQAQLNELKKDPAWLDQNQLKPIRTRLAELNQQAAGGSGGGSVPPTARGAAGGGMGGDGNTNGILRDILTALNGIHKTLQTGVRVTGAGTAKAQRVDKDGNPIAAKPRSLNSATREELRQAGITATGSARQDADPTGRQQALAVATQQHRLERLKESDIDRAQGAAIEEDARRTRKAAEETRKGSAITAAAAHSKLQLAQAMDLVDNAARNELAELARLNKEGVTGTRLAEQQARAYTAVNRAMLKRGVEGGDRRAHGRTLLNAQGGEDITGQFYDTIARSARGGAGAAKGAKDGLASALFGDTGFWSRVVHSTGTFLVRNFTAGFVFGVTNALQEVVKQAIVTEQTFVRVSNALDATGKHVGGLRSDLQRISTDYGTSLNDVYDVAAGLVGLFKSPIQIASATRVVAQLETISDGALNAQEAMGVLGSITSSYSDELGNTTEGFTHVADVLTTIQNVIGTNVEVTAEGVASLSGLAKQLHLTFEQTAVMVAQIAKQTNQTGAAAGEQFGRILGSLQTGRGQGAVTRAFTEAGNAGKINKDQTTALSSAFQNADYGSALTILMKNWDSLSKSQQRNIAIQVAGQRQMRAFAALMGNTKATLKDIDRATYESGSAQDRMNKIMHQLNGQIRILGANFQNLANNLVRSGILDAVAGSLRLVNLALGGINDVLTKLNDFVDSNAATRMLKHLTFGILGLVAAMKLLAVAKRGVQGAIASRLGIEVGGAAAEKDLLSDGSWLGVGGGSAAGAGKNPGMLAQLLGARRAGQAADDVEKLSASQRLRNRATALRASSVAYGERAGASGMGSMLALTAGRAGLDSAVGQGANAARLAALEKASAGSAHALTGTAAGLEVLAEGGLAVQAPLAAAGVGLLALVDNISRTGKAATENASLLKEFNKRFGLEDKPDQSDKVKSGWQKFGGKASATWRATGDYIGEFSRDVTHPSQWGKLITGGVQGVAKRGIARDKGTYADNLNMGYGVADAQALLNSGTKTLDNVQGGPKALLHAQKDFNKRLEKARDEIVNDSSTSAGQKQQAIKALEQAGIAFADQTSILILKAKGLGKADALTTAQINSANTAIQTMGQLGGAGSVQGVDLTPLYDSLKDEVGAGKGSKLNGLLAEMSSGTADDLTMGLDTRKVLQDLLTQTQTRLQTLDPSNDEYAGLQQLAGQLGQELLGSTQTLLDTLNTNAQTAAGVLAKRGRYGAAAGQYSQGIDQAKADLAAAKGPPKALMGPVPGFMQVPEGQKKKKIASIQASLDGMDQAVTDMLLEQRLEKLKAALALADPEAAKKIQREIDRVTAAFLGKRAKDVPGSVSPDQLNSSNQAVTTDNQTKAQDALAKKQAAIQTQVAAAGPGNAMAIARGQLAIAQLAQAQAGKISKTSVDYQQATQQVIAAQYGIISAEGDIAQANASLRAAYANARGDTVGAAKAGLQAANAALAYAKRLSGGARSAEVINAQAQVVSARASIRDARLQDQLDTIDFNLQMGKITQSSAIAALREILRTSNLTKQQRRQLMLQIKGMEKEISDGPWNFGDIKLPKPYLMKRYIEEQRTANAQRIDSMVGGSMRASTAVSSALGAAQQSYNDNRNVEILINGGNLDQIRKVLREVIGTPTRTRTAAPRRGRR